MEFLKPSVLIALSIASRLAIMVVLPLLVLGGGGLLLDRSAGTLPRYLFIGIGVAFAVTIYWMSKQFKHVVTTIINEEDR